MIFLQTKNGEELTDCMQKWVRWDYPLAMADT